MDDAGTAQLDRLSEAGGVDETINLTTETTCLGEEQESDLLPILRCGINVSSQDNPKHFYVRRKWGIYFVIPAVATTEIRVNGRRIPTSRFLQTGDVITCTACRTDFLVRIASQSRLWCWFLRFVGLVGLAASLLVPFLDQIRDRPFDNFDQTLKIYPPTFVLAALSIVLIIGTIPKAPKPRIPKRERKTAPVPETKPMVRESSGTETGTGPRTEDRPTDIGSSVLSSKNKRTDEVH